MFHCNKLHCIFPVYVRVLFKGTHLEADNTDHASLDRAAMAAAATLAEHFTFRVGHVDDVETIAANNIAMAQVSGPVGVV